MLAPVSKLRKQQVFDSCIDRRLSYSTHEGCKCTWFICYDRLQFISVWQCTFFIGLSQPLALDECLSVQLTRVGTPIHSSQCTHFTHCALPVKAHLHSKANSKHNMECLSNPA